MASFDSFWLCEYDGTARRRPSKAALIVWTRFRSRALATILRERLRFLYDLAGLFVALDDCDVDDDEEVDVEGEVFPLVSFWSPHIRS